jgi:hypothetical protein
MNTEPPTGDDLTRMLVSMKTNVLERATDVPRRRRPGRRFGIAFGLVALIGLGSAGGAVALGLVPSPFEGLAQPEPTAVVSAEPAPSPTPTTAPPEPSAAPSTQPVGSTPQPYVPIDCATLATESSLTSLLRAPELGRDDGFVFTPREASLRQNGVLSCSWTSTSETASAEFEVDIALDGPDSAEGLAANRQGGGPLEVGDDSAMACRDGFTCFGTVVVGDYWIEAGYTQSQTSGGETDDLVGAQLGRLADVVRPLEPRLPWVASDAAQRWAVTGDCTTLALGTPLSTVFTDAGLDEVATEITPDGRNIIDATLTADYGCAWEVQAEGVEYPGSLGVQVAGGARWGYEGVRDYLTSGQGADGLSVTDVTVEGAESAFLSCGSSDAVCYLDVLVDDSWLRVLYDGGSASQQGSRLVEVAENVIAAR